MPPFQRRAAAAFGANRLKAIAARCVAVVENLQPSARAERSETEKEAVALASASLLLSSSDGAPTGIPPEASMQSRSAAIRGNTALHCVAADGAPLEGISEESKEEEWRDVPPPTRPLPMTVLTWRAMTRDSARHCC